MKIKNKKKEYKTHVDILLLRLRMTKLIKLGN